MNAARPNPASRNDEKIRYITHKAKTLTEDISELLDLYYKLAMVTATEKASSAAAVTITATVIISLFMFVLFFLGLGLGWFLGDKLNSMLAGYSIVATFFTLLIFVTLWIRKNVLFPFIRNLVIRRIYE